VTLPSEWVKLVKNANKKIRSKLFYVNHYLTDDLNPDSSNLCTVFDYNNFLDLYLKSKVSHLTEVRRIRFTENSIKVSRFEI
jgi:predicted extracellular nuclease